MNYYNQYEKIRPFIYKIETPHAHGTGFQVSVSERSNFMAIVTAFHVIKEVDIWELPIIISSESLDIKYKIYAQDRVIMNSNGKDAAIIIFKLPPDHSIKLAPNSALASLPYVNKNTELKIGSFVGWAGFPGIINCNKPSFFAGHISSVGTDLTGKYYMIDGNAINGVSGGPVFADIIDPKTKSSSLHTVCT